MLLNNAGKQAERCWLAIPEHFQNVVLHEFVIMPNHVRGIIEINGTSVRAKHLSSSEMKGTNDDLTPTAWYIANDWFNGAWF